MVPYTLYSYIRKFLNEKNIPIYKFQQRDKIKTCKLLHKKNWTRKLKHIK